MELELKSTPPVPVSERRSTGAVRDRFGRPLGSLRISVTDRCNLRCAYCMPEEDYTWLEHREILSFEEIAKLTEIFSDLGIDNVRLTGGEPLLRRDLGRLIQMLARLEGIQDLSLTTNGVMLASQARALREAGLDRVTVSLDTLRPDRFRALARRDTLGKVLEGISAARGVGFARLKINSVIMRGFNDDELASLLRFGRDAQAEVRFIEYMDVGGATRWSTTQVFSRADMLASLERDFGPVEAIRNEDSSAPAARFRLADGTVFGIIASTTRPFCGTCDRARLTPDGMLLLCLYASAGVDLKRALRSGGSREEIAEVIRAAWTGRRDRGAEDRRGLNSRGALVGRDELRKDPHLEMHTRGG